MTQTDFGTIDPATKSGTALATDLNAWRDTIHSQHKGGSRPSYATAGIIWINDTTIPWVLNLYDGAEDIPIGTFNPTTNIFSVPSNSTELITTTGSANVYAATVSSTPAAYAAGMFVRIAPNFVNTGSCTINVNTLGAKTAKDLEGNALVGGELLTTGIYDLVYNGTDFIIISTSVSTGLIGRQIFTASGTWTPTTGTDAVVVTVIGGGGGGGGINGLTSSAGGASGGGGGGAAIEYITSGLGATEIITIGGGGAGGSAGANAGSGGGTSSFGSHCSATGGNGADGRTAQSGPNCFEGESGGVGSGGDLNIQGGASGGGFNVSTSNALGGTGGNSILGGGGRSLPSPNTGVAGGNYGGGGSGAASDTATNYAGGDGADGVIIIEEYRL